MAAYQTPDVAVPHVGYQSEDEDSFVEFDINQFPDDDDPAVVLEAEPAPEEERWVPRDASGWEHYIPTFTRPGYDDAMEVKSDGQMQKPWGGGPREKMRPALLPTDPPASQYARRFGIFPDRKVNQNSEARSMLTPVPTSMADSPPDSDGFQWEFEQSFQAIFFQFFTTKELADLGAFDPNQVVQRPDSHGNLHPLLTRDKWTQQPFERDSPADKKENVSLTIWYNLNGEKKPWDVQHNDELWNALQPALQMASKVLLSGHPFWKAILNIYHMRPVPEEKDGRTQQEKADPKYRSYISIWYDINRDKMYRSARSLMDQNFDSTAATLEVLSRLLKFTIIRSDKGSASGSTRFGGSEPGKRSIRIVINANFIWPLLVPQYSVSEKISVSFYIARLILHELTHAARMAINYQVMFPDVLTDPPWTPPPGTAFNRSITNELESLCFDAFSIPFTEVFFQDVSQMEEGKCFELELFGFDTTYGPTPADGRHGDACRPIMAALAWPWKHPMIHLQNQKAVDAGQYGAFTTAGYSTYLLDPPASAYDLYTPLPVSSFAKFMQQSWWDTDFVKFGHQALKIPIHSTDPSSPFKTIARPSDSLADFAPFLTPVIRSRIAFAFLFSYAIPRLYDQEQTAILDYLTLLTREAVAARVMRNRLHYEKRAWPTRLRKILHLSGKATQSFDTVWDIYNQTSQRPLSENTADEVLQLVPKIREFLIHLMELIRQVGVEIQYSQAIAAQYILKPPEERRKIHRRYMRFLRENLVEMRNSITSFLVRAAPRHEQGDQREWKTITAPWEATFVFMVEQNRAALSTAAQQAINRSIGSLTNIRNYTEEKCGELLNTSNHMQNILPILDEQYIDFPIASAPNGLFPGVPIAMQMMELSKIMEKRAVYEIVRLNDPDLEKIIRQWMRILETHVGLSSRVDVLREELNREKQKTVILTITTVLFQAKRREVGPAGPTHDGRHPRDLLVDTARGQIMLLLGEDRVLRAWLRQVCIEEQDEEEFDNIMRIVHRGPAPQEAAS